MLPLLPWDLVPAAVVPMLDALRAAAPVALPAITATMTVGQALRLVWLAWPGARL